MRSLDIIGPVPEADSGLLPCREHILPDASPDGWVGWVVEKALGLQLGDGVQVLALLPLCM